MEDFIGSVEIHFIAICFIWKKIENGFLKKISLTVLQKHLRIFTWKIFLALILNVAAISDMTSHCSEPWILLRAQGNLN